MPRGFVFALSFVLIGLVPAVALGAGAAAEDCPEGWFCEPNAAPQPPAPSPPPPPMPQSRPPEPGVPPAPTTAAPPNGAGAPGYPPPGAPPPVYYPPPIYSAPPTTGEAAALPAPPPKRHRGFREWGFNLHLEAALLGDQPERDQAMGGFGFGFRYRVMPMLAFEAGVDLLRGQEHQGYYRNEAALLLNTLVFFNPRSVVQVYGLAGLGISRTGITYVHHSDEPYFKRSEEHQSYFGGQLGLGVEVRVSRRVGIGADLVGFMRGRTDDREDTEFIDGNSQRQSDSDGGGLLRAGVTFYW